MGCVSRVFEYLESRPEQLRNELIQSGAIQQIGGPRDIYERPINRFVADFIGDTNFLEAEITAIDGGQADCRVSPRLSLRVQSVAAHNPGDRVTLAIRPEKISLNSDGGIEGRITEAVYLGTDVSYEIDLGDDLSVAVRDQSDVSGQARFSPGDRVGVGLAPAALRMLVD